MHFGRLRVFRVRSAVRAVAVVLAAAVVGLATLSCGGEAGDRIARIYELKSDPTPANLQRVREFLDDPDPNVRATAMFQLMVAGEIDATALGLRGLEDEHAVVRMIAADELGLVDDPAAVEPLSGRVREDPDAAVRRRAAESLGELGFPSGVPALKVALGDPAQEVRMAAVKAAVEVEPAACAGEFARLLELDPEWEVRVRAARALGSSGVHDVAEPVLAAAVAEDEHEFVRLAAQHALDNLARVPRAPTPEPPAADATDAPASPDVDPSAAAKPEADGSAAGEEG